jgi:hypothetical protein
MSTYTTAKNVQSYFMGVDFTTSDFITQADVKRWIEEDSINIDNSLRRKYTLPISNSNDLIFLKSLTEKFVVARIDSILRVSANEENSKFDRTRNYGKEAKETLKNLIDGVILLETSPKCLAPISYRQGSY